MCNFNCCSNAFFLSCYTGSYSPVTYKLFDTIGIGIEQSLGSYMELTDVKLDF